ncbi:MAG: lysyl endopeptidase, partial [Macellibacteroides fermentans]|nr:lysyl endopeptidase [Macellibacteroides fermentans]
MKTNIVALVLVLLCISAKGVAQISHGGSPLPMLTLKSNSADFFVEMPAFDVAEELRVDSLNESDLRGGFRFAYKFMTSLNVKTAGTSFTMADGTKVWRLGIRSA